MELAVVASILIIGFAVVFYLLSKKGASKNDETLLEWVKQTQQSMEAQSKVFHELLQNSNSSINSALQNQSKALNERLDNAAKVIGQVQKNIGEMSEIGRGMKELQEFLSSPKLRGNIGEHILSDLLGQMLPKNSFHLQYAFKSGSIVDAAIKTEAGIVPIDSKFPMENFRKMNSAKTEEEKKYSEKLFTSDVKKHIDVIAKKYILTGEGTIDYALMYIPSESIYYEIVNNPSLFDYSSKKRVLPVSPMTFYAYLKAILMGFEGQKISRQAQEILAGIRSIQTEYENLTLSIDTLTRHLTNASNTLSQVHTKSNRLGQKISSASLIEKEEKSLLDNIPDPELPE